MLFRSFLKKNSSSIFDAGTTRITGVSAPTVASDAATKAYVDSVAVVAGNLPNVNTSDNGSLLRVTAGAWTTTATDAVSTAQIQNLAVTGAKLENSGVVAGTYGASTAIPQITVDAKGRVTSVLQQNCTPVDGSVSTAKIADSAVTTAKIADTSITTAKIADSNITTSKIADSNITTAKIADGSVTSSKLAAGAAFPSQAGNSGLYLTTNGTSASWATSPTGFRNRIINGGMRIDQRNAGASVTISNVFHTDRWQAYEDSDGTMTAQQDSSAPSGFSNSLKITTTVADSSLSAAQYACLLQSIEGYNVGDLAFGTASAKSITLSFWVRSSLTGTFGGVIKNTGAGTRSYPFTYSISSANTWEQKTITIAGDTSGSWATDNSCGMQVLFGLGVGSTYSGTAGAWAGSNLISATGAVSVLGTLNATWYITGVQLESGSTATDFERRPFATELSLCQRYYEKSFDLNTVPQSTFSGSLGNSMEYWQMQNPSGGGTAVNVYFKQNKRLQATIVTYNNASSGSSHYHVFGLGDYTNASVGISERGFRFSMPTDGANNFKGFNWTASAEL